MFNTSRMVQKTLKAAASSLLALLIFNSGLAAYETKYKDTKDEKTEVDNAEFKVDGVIFAGYEKADKEKNGVYDSTGTRQQTNGFVVPRAYVNLKGQMIDGGFKGYGFRLTLDGGPLLVANQNTSNSTTNTGSNAQAAELKFAYFFMPLYSSFLGNGEFRLGQQHLPVVDGQAGYSAESAWKHRYIDQVASEKILFAGASADRGISYIHKGDYFGLHVMLANGEGFRRNNGQAIGSLQPVTASGGTATTGIITTTQAAQIRTNLQNYGNGPNGGTADSYGLDLYGVPSIKPTGKSKDIEANIGFPFRLQNVTGIRKSEWENYVIDLPTTTSATSLGKLEFYHGDARAKQDTTMGPEASFAMDLGMFKFTVGGGHFLYKDKRSTAYRVDQNALTDIIATTNTNFAGAAAGIPPGYDYSTMISAEKDATGQSNYGFINIKFGQFGIVARQIFGTSAGNGSSTLGALPSKSYLAQVIEVDMRNGRMGDGDINFNSTRGSSPTINLGLARFKHELYAVTWQPMSKLALSVGVTFVRTKEQNGEPTKVNPFTAISAVTPNATSSNNVSSQTDSLTGTLSGGASPLLMNDVAGEARNQKQVFFRAQYEY